MRFAKWVFLLAWLTPLADRHEREALARRDQCNRRTSPKKNCKRRVAECSTPLRGFRRVRRQHPDQFLQQGFVQTLNLAVRQRRDAGGRTCAVRTLC